MRSAVAGLPRGAAAAGNRSDVGQDLDDLLADLGACPRAYDRCAVRPAGTSCTAPRRKRKFTPPRRHDCAEVRLPRHGRVSRQGDSRPMCSCARSIVLASSKSVPASPCRRTFPIRSKRSSESTIGLAARVAAGGSRRDDPPREGRQHGGRARRSQPPRLAAGPVQNQARNRRQLSPHAPRRNAARESRGRPPRHRVAQPVHARLRAGARDESERRSIVCSSKCSKAWPTISAGLCSS